jgi:hypothetical protein
MSTSAPSDATADALSDLMEVMIEVKDTLRQIASAVRTLASSGSD